MAEILFSNNPHFYGQWCWTQPECLSGKIRLSIFLIIGECVGLPAVLWTLRFLYHRYKTGSRVSAFMITLLLCDLLVLLLNPYIVTKLLRDEMCWERRSACWIFSSLWSTSIICGNQLQQVVALEAALALRYPPCSVHVLFPPCSILISIMLFIYFFLCELLWEPIHVLFTLPLLLVITLISWIVTCRTPPGISDTPYRPRRPSFTVLALVTLTLIPYGTFISTCIIMGFTSMCPFSVFVMAVSLMSLNVIIDPLLCVIIYRKSTELNQSEVNT